MPFLLLLPIPTTYRNMLSLPMATIPTFSSHTACVYLYEPSIHVGVPASLLYAPSTYNSMEQVLLGSSFCICSIACGMVGSLLCAGHCLLWFLLLGHGLFRDREGCCWAFLLPPPLQQHGNPASVWDNMACNLSFLLTVSSSFLFLQCSIAAHLPTPIPLDFLLCLLGSSAHISAFLIPHFSVDILCGIPPVSLPGQHGQTLPWKAGAHRKKAGTQVPTPAVAGATPMLAFFTFTMLPAHYPCAGVVFWLYAPNMTGFPGMQDAPSMPT